MSMTANDAKNLTLNIISQLRSFLLLFASFGIALLLAGWIAPRFGVTFIRLPSAEPQSLVYAAGIVWLLK